MNNDAISKLKPDADNPGWVLGWGVVRESPWNLHGIFASKDEAEVAAQQVGNNHIARFGSHRPGTDDFVWNSVS
ncbi:hypothetical protein ACFW6U_09805 [Pseudomonas guariconensis]|uniref:hypothetical protein n=1 Tax=Pseudomonas guariconensis TaxID=1288410 RepID=UPI00366C3E21